MDVSDNQARALYQRRIKKTRATPEMVTLDSDYDHTTQTWTTRTPQAAHLAVAGDIFVFYHPDRPQHQMVGTVYGDTRFYFDVCLFCSHHCNMCALHFKLTPLYYQQTRKAETPKVKRRILERLVEYEGRFCDVVHSRDYRKKRGGDGWNKWSVAQGIDVVWIIADAEGNLTKPNNARNWTSQSYNTLRRHVNPAGNAKSPNSDTANISYSTGTGIVQPVRSTLPPINSDLALEWDLRHREAIHLSGLMHDACMEYPLPSFVCKAMFGIS